MFATAIEYRTHIGIACTRLTHSRNRPLLSYFHFSYRCRCLHLINISTQYHGFGKNLSKASAKRSEMPHIRPHMCCCQWWGNKYWSETYTSLWRQHDDANVDVDDYKNPNIITWFAFFSPSHAFRCRRADTIMQSIAILMSFTFTEIISPTIASLLSSAKLVINAFTTLLFWQQFFHSFIFHHFPQTTTEKMKRDPNIQWRETTQSQKKNIHIFRYFWQRNNRGQHVWVYGVRVRKVFLALVIIFSFFFLKRRIPFLHFIELNVRRDRTVASMVEKYYYWSSLCRRRYY